MDTQTLRMFTLAAAGATALLVATDAKACDQCLNDTQHSNSGICWSGFNDGYSTCTGGQADGESCTLGSSCSRTESSCPGCSSTAWNSYSCWAYTCS
jgi:hypothetical protein